MLERVSSLDEGGCSRSSKMQRKLLAIRQALQTSTQHRGEFEWNRLAFSERQLEHAALDRIERVFCHLVEHRLSPVYLVEIHQAPYCIPRRSHTWLTATRFAPPLHPA